MVFHNFEELRASLPTGQDCKIGAVACAHDKTTLSACVHCRGLGSVDFCLVGLSDQIAQYLEELGQNPTDYTIVHADDDVSACKEAVALVRAGKAGFLLKGKVDTPVLLKAVVNKEEGLYDGKLMSHLAFLQLPTYDRLVVITDSGMVTLPDLEQLKIIVENATQTLQAMGYETPYGGVLSANEKVNAKVPASVMAAELVALNRSGALSGCHIEGPVSYDVLMNAAIAKKKGYEGSVPGQCDMMIVPDMAMGNVLGKALCISGGAKMAGIIVGAKAPIALTSRGSSDEEKINSILLAASCGQ